MSYEAFIDTFLTYRFIGWAACSRQFDLLALEDLALTSVSGPVFGVAFPGAGGDDGQAVAGAFARVGVSGPKRFPGGAVSPVALGPGPVTREWRWGVRSGLGRLGTLGTLHRPEPSFDLVVSGLSARICRSTHPAALLRK